MPIKTDQKMLGMFIIGEDTEMRRLDTRFRIQRGTSRRVEALQDLFVNLFDDKEAACRGSQEFAILQFLYFHSSGRRLLDLGYWVIVVRFSSNFN